MTLIRPRRKPAQVERYIPPGWMQPFIDGALVPPMPPSLYGKKPTESINTDFVGYALGALAADPVVFGVEQRRLNITGQARFAWRQFIDGKPQTLFTNRDLQLLQRPWRGGTTGKLIKRKLLDADMAGNSYTVQIGDALVRLRPDWVDIVLAPRMAPYDPDDAGAMVQVGYEVVGYLYYEGGKSQCDTPAAFLPESVCHFAPQADPLSPSGCRGMSWLTPVVREVMADKAMTEHQLTSLEHGASVNLVVTLPQGTTRQQLVDFKEVFTEEHVGPANADRPLFLTGGADVTLVGSNMQQLDFKAIRGAGETRVAMAAGVHPVVLGSSEGMQGSSLNAGNYGAAKRATGDVTIRDLWAELCGSLQTLLPEQSPGVELWYDESDVAFLRDDQTDQAAIAFREAQTMRTLRDGGWTPESIVAAVRAADWSLLKHSGLPSVQEQAAAKAAPLTAGGEGGDGV